MAEGLGVKGSGFRVRVYGLESRVKSLGLRA
jgi:hypothetical protein